MMYESGQRKSKTMKWRTCVLGAVVGAVLASTAQATPAALADVMTLAKSMRIREATVAGIQTKAKAAYPNLTTTQLTCVKAASMSPMVGSHAVAIQKALTKEEVASAQKFYASAEGQAYLNKQGTTTALTSTESTAVNTFLATTAGQKLVKNKSYITTELNTQLSSELTQIVKGCP